jgi:Ca2+-binding RTX toxin-like protein
VQAAIVNGDLVITGSRDRDHVDVRLDRKGEHLLVNAGGHSIGSFDLAAVGTIRFNGLAGNDRIFINPRIHLTTILNGGAGDDFLEGGQGNNILLGGAGNDTLLGHRGRDLLIGGDGMDRLQGKSNDDLLIGGSTNYDDNDSSLLQILAAWTSTDSYNTRVDNLRNGIGGVPVLNSTTVTDDHTRDRLFGGPGLDWFFAAGEDLTPGKLHVKNIN